jgi:SET domain-containing protein
LTFVYLDLAVWDFVIPNTNLRDFAAVEGIDAAGTEPETSLDTLYTKVSWYVGDVSASEWKVSKCGCRVDCKEQCKNRKRRIECDRTTCNLKGACCNRRWAMYESRPTALKVGDTRRMGYGVYALEAVGKGTIVCKYVGEIIDEKEKERRAAEPGCAYLMAYANNKYVDAKRYGNESRFINHSCEPNCRAEEWTVQGVYRIGVVAGRDISTGEEITFNYGSQYVLETCKCRRCMRGR